MAGVREQLANWPELVPVIVMISSRVAYLFGEKCLALVVLGLGAGMGIGQALMRLVGYHRA